MTQSKILERPFVIIIDDKFSIIIKYKDGKFEMVSQASATFPYVIL